MPLIVFKRGYRKSKSSRYAEKKFGEKIKTDIKVGNDFPEDLSCYDLIIQCGGCMFNRKHILSGIKKAKEQNVPITNYGIFIAKINDIPDKIDLN